MPIKKNIRDIQGFPKAGILFKDITPLLIDPQARTKCLEILLSGLKDRKIDKVVGVESRGFFFGMLLAHELNAGFIPVRKPKKLPYKTISATYDLEYGTDTLEIHTDAIQKGIEYSFTTMFWQRAERQKRFANWLKNWVAKLCNSIS